MTFTCFDATSALAEPCPSSVTLGDGEDQSVPGSVTDNAGNSNAAAISDIDVDTTLPTITASISPSAAASGWYNAATGTPTVSFTCSDATSGLADPCPSSASLGDGADQSVSGSVTDNAGNSNSAAVSDIDVDTSRSGNNGQHRARFSRCERVVQRLDGRSHRQLHLLR